MYLPLKFLKISQQAYQSIAMSFQRMACELQHFRRTHHSPDQHTKLQTLYDEALENLSCTGKCASSINAKLEQLQGNLRESYATKASIHAKLATTKA